MAKATKVIHRLQLSEEELRKSELESIESMLLANKEAIQETFKILNHLQDRGILEMGTALLSQGDKVMDILVKTADSPETTNTLKNLLLMLGTLGTLNVQQLEPLILKVNTGIARISELSEEDEKGGYFTLLRSLTDPDVKRAMAVGITFLKGIGEKQDDLERTTKTPEDQQHEQNDQDESDGVQRTVGSEPTSIPSEGTHDSKEKHAAKRPGGKSWLLAAAGVSLLSIPLTLAIKKKERATK
ncbi:hypothetical protein KR50_11620 [Jeotgalibacillus campisalis]|uniref:DUF1641 domain-containing protein n=1 Tax=Jeotgalibacillus campisalis TaxID=220754 RepID=A0A0C2VJS1_9BACL|nr:hypothetical protein KR50_11620 [Jeotgalibacillus campisalis]